MGEGRGRGRILEGRAFLLFITRRKEKSKEESRGFTCRGRRKKAKQTREGGRRRNYHFLLWG